MSREKLLAFLGIQLHLGVPFFFGLIMYAYLYLTRNFKQPWVILLLVYQYGFAKKSNTMRTLFT